MIPRETKVALIQNKIKRRIERMVKKQAAAERPGHKVGKRIGSPEYRAMIDANRAMRNNARVIELLRKKSKALRGAELLANLQEIAYRLENGMLLKAAVDKAIAAWEEERMNRVI